MKRVLTVISLLFLPLTALSTEITDTVTVSTYVRPDVYTVPITVAVEASTEKEVLNTLAVVDKSVRNLGMEYRGGVFNVYENREWNPNKKRYLSKGFRGNTYYRFLLKNIKAEDKIFLKLQDLKSKYRFKFFVSNPHWAVSSNRYNMQQEKLKRKLLRKLKREATVYGKELREACTIETVDFSTFHPLPFRGMVESIKVQAPQPRRNNQELSVTARVKFGCR